MKGYILFIVLVLVLSCTSAKNIEGTNSDGSPAWTQEIPKSSRYIYGVGKAKLSNKLTSQDAADRNANADLARNIQKRLEEGTANHVGSSSSVANAYEKIIVQTVNLTLKGVVVEKRWLAPDETAWTLVSFNVKDLPELYAQAANGYMKALDDENGKLREQEQKLNTESEGTIVLDQAYSPAPETAIKMNEVVLETLEASGDFKKTMASYLKANGYDLSGE